MAQADQATALATPDLTASATVTDGAFRSPRSTEDPRAEQSSEQGTSERTNRTWRIVTATGASSEGYLPSWADDDPSETGVPADQLSNRLSDVSHRELFDGQSLRLASPQTPESPGDFKLFWGSIDCNPYDEDPESRIPIVNLAIIEDFWITGLDPDGTADVAAKLRAQADRLDNEVIPRLVAARDDWEAHHRLRP
jgi:hypothetical protein